MPVAATQTMLELGRKQDILGKALMLYELAIAGNKSNVLIQNNSCIDWSIDRVIDWLIDFTWIWE